MSSPPSFVNTTPVRVLHHFAPASGAWNMAVDESLLEHATEPVVRVYRWGEPTLSLGHFQKRDSVPEDRFGAIPIVRRLSGGGAILHDHEWTYSLVVPKTHPLATDPRSLYGPAHRAIIDLMSERGVTTIRERGESDASAEDNVLCFARRDAQDLVIGTDKVLGSAQRRRQGAILQHGSLLLKRSPLTPEFPGVFDLSDRSELEDTFGETLATRLARTLGDAIEPGELTAEEHRTAERLQPEKFA